MYMMLQSIAFAAELYNENCGCIVCKISFRNCVRVWICSKNEWRENSKNGVKLNWEENTQKVDQGQDENIRLGRMLHRGKEGRSWEEIEEFLLEDRHWEAWLSDDAHVVETS
jgi:hypothetical protein